MLRYLRIYLCLLRYSFSRAMEFRIDFFFRIIMDLVYYAVNVGFFKVLFMHTDSLAGWNENQAMLFVAFYLVVDAFYMTMFSNNLWQLPTAINRGGLDYHLVRPVATLFFVTMREFAASSFVNLLAAVGILVWALSLNPEVVTPVKLLALPLLVAGGLSLHYMLALLFVIPVFWTHSGSGPAMLFHIFTQFMERPDRIYRGFVRVIVTVILPFAVIASFPVRLFMEAFDPGLALHLAAVIGVFALVVRWLWGRGLKAYGSASS